MKKKELGVKIIQITFKPDGSYIFGLGDDGLVYLYNASTHDWTLWG
jgi:WD40 repeat protein